MITYQVSNKIGDKIVLVKSESDEAEVAWTDFGAALNMIAEGGAQQALKDLRQALTTDPLAAATGVAVAALPVASVQPPAEQWGNPPVPPMGVPQHYAGGQVPTQAQVYPSQQAAPAAPAMPASATPSCQHGVKKYISKPATGTKKAWQAWGCPAPQGDPTGCGLEFIR